MRHGGTPFLLKTLAFGTAVPEEQGGRAEESWERLLLRFFFSSVP